MKDTIGKWAFIVGLVIAIIAGFSTFQHAGLILVVLGLIVGFLNVSGHETRGFLIASIALLMAGSGALEVFGTLGTTLATMLKNLIAFISAAVLVVALRALFETMRD